MVKRQVNEPSFKDKKTEKETNKNADQNFRQETNEKLKKIEKLSSRGKSDTKILLNNGQWNEKQKQGFLDCYLTEIIKYPFKDFQNDDEDGESTKPRMGFYERMSKRIKTRCPQKCRSRDQSIKKSYKNNKGLSFLGYIIQQSSRYPQLARKLQKVMNLKDRSSAHMQIIDERMKIHSETEKQYKEALSAIKLSFGMTK